MFRDNNPLPYTVITRKLNYDFKNKELLLQALTRPSGVNETSQEKDIGHFQRLELLGNKVLNLVVADSLMAQHPHDNEHQLPRKIKQKVRDKGTLSQIAKRLDLGKWLIMGKREEKRKGRHDEKILADTMEALIGAIFLDSGKDYEFVAEFINTHWAAVENEREINVTTNVYGIFSATKLPSVTVQVVLPLYPGYKTQELITAIFKHDYDYIAMLVKHGADLEAQGHYFYEIWVPIGCKEYGDEIGIEKIEFEGNALAAMVEAGLCDGSDNKFIELLLQYSANPNQYGIVADGVMRHGNKENVMALISLLLKYGANSNNLQQELKKFSDYSDKEDILAAASDFLAKPMQCQIQKVAMASEPYDDTLPGVRQYQPSLSTSQAADVNSYSTNCLIM